MQAKLDFLQQRLKDIHKQKAVVHEELTLNGEAIIKVQGEVDRALACADSGMPKYACTYIHLVVKIHFFMRIK